MTSRLVLMMAAMLLFALVSTRFLPPSPLALSSGITPLTSVAFELSKNVRRTLDAVIVERDLAAENAQLKRRVGELEAKNYSLEREVSRLARVAQIRQRQSPGVVATASVIKWDIGVTGALLTIQAGRNEGVRLKMPVTTPQGLVGEISEVGASTSVVRTLVDPEFAIGVSLRNKGRALARGIGADRIRAEGFTGLTIKPGDVVLSLNSAGGVFPTVPVGTVERVLPLRGDSPSQTVIITPTVDLRDLDEVFVLRLP